jgi:hypothetical protein
LGTDAPIVAVDPPHLSRAAEPKLLVQLLHLSKHLVHGGGDALVPPPLRRDALGFPRPDRNALSFQYRIDADAGEWRLDVTFERIHQQFLKLPSRARRRIAIVLVSAMLESGAGPQVVVRQRRVDHDVRHFGRHPDAPTG